MSPWDAGAPAIHGPDLTGASARKPFLYAIPCTGERPIRYAAEGLPSGLALDAGTGRISGSAAQEGDFQVLLKAENRHGKAEKEFTVAIGRGLALTPPMGWNSWNAWRQWVSDARVRAAADGLVRTGLAARGYTYVNMDSCWQGRRGGPHGAIQPNSKFPDMKALADYVHGLGLKIGIYSTPWVEPCGCGPAEAAEWGGGRLIGCSSGEPDPDYPPPPKPPNDYKYVGRIKHEPADVAQWMEWGMDFLKYDWQPTDPLSTERMGRLLKDGPRDMVMSVCTAARLKDAGVLKKWCHMWRGLPDTVDTWFSVMRQAFFWDDMNFEDWRPHIGPGGWHDLDMLALGPQFDTAESTRPNRMTGDEQITGMTSWALYPSPLFLSCNLDGLSDFELRLFANEEVLAVNQDRLGRPAVRLREECSQTFGMEPCRKRCVHARPLADGSFAVGFYNLAEADDEVTLLLKDLGLAGSVSARSLWERRDLGRFEGQVTVPVPAHGAQMLKIRR